MIISIKRLTEFLSLSTKLTIYIYSNVSRGFGQTRIGISSKNYSFFNHLVCGRLLKRSEILKNNHKNKININ